MLTQADAANYHALQSDPEVTRFLGGPTERNIDYYRQRLAAIKPKLDSPLAITSRETGEFLGTCGFTHDPVLDGWELNVVLARQNWGHGLASEIVEALLQIAFRKLGFCALFGVADPQNSGSIALLRKFGFERQQIRYGRWGIESEVYATRPQI